MDWNVTARSLEPHVRAPLAERELETWALLDASASMDFGTALSEKRDLADRRRRGGRSAHRPARQPARRAHLPSATTCAGSRPHRRRSHAPPYAPHAAVVAPGNTRRPSGDRLGAAISRLDREHRAARAARGRLRLPRRDGWADPLRRLAARHEVIAVEVLDPRELELPDVGLLTLVDPETGRRREVQTSQPETAPPVRRRDGRAPRTDTPQAIRAAGAGHLVLRTDTDWVRDVAAVRHRPPPGRRPPNPMAKRGIR